jgi:L-threonylcarbamoyladenylate synthase
MNDLEKRKISFKNLKLVIKKTAALIKKGGVIVCPTDTVYGLIADARNKKAVKKIFKIKKRKKEKPIPIFVKDLKMAKSLAIFDKTQEKFLKRVWPGKVTVILKAKNKKFPNGILSEDKKIGLRIPNYTLLNNLLKKLNFPLAETSANISGKPASTKIKEILKQFKNEGYDIHKINSYGSIRIAEARVKEGRRWDFRMLILDAGNLKPSQPSTVVDLTNLKILREGAEKLRIFKI